MSNVAMGGKCPKCGSELRVSWCARCFGTGRSGKHKCKACGGKGTTTACPDVRSHKSKLFQIWTTFTQAAR
jgi:DnaJ-class molecular chaperone